MNRKLNYLNIFFFRFATPFLEEIKNWEEKLCIAYEVLTKWLMLQNNLLDIKHIFQETQLQKQLSDGYKHFDLVKKQFSKVYKI